MSKSVIKSFILGKDGTPLILDYSVKEGVVISRGELSELLEQERESLRKLKEGRSVSWKRRTGNRLVLLIKQKKPHL